MPITISHSLLNFILIHYRTWHFVAIIYYDFVAPTAPTSFGFNHSFLQLHLQLSLFRSAFTGPCFETRRP